jgi:uncharacterized protein (DUF1015 family)
MPVGLTLRPPNRTDSMAALVPLKTLRPDPSVARRVASVPYDVVSTAEARGLAAGNPLSFLHVTRPEIDLPPETAPYDEAVYAQAVRNFEELKRAAPLIVDEAPSIYGYRLRMGRHEQVGVAGGFSIEEYNRGIIRKHETTRPDKEDDRTRHMLELRAQTGLVFLTHRAAQPIDDIMERVSRQVPLYDFAAPDGVQHTVWAIGGVDRDALVRAFAHLDALYIADGHHRAASAARARQVLGRSGAAADTFVAVAFPDRQLQILPYNRVVKDLAGRTPESFLEALGSVCGLGEGSGTPAEPRLVSMFLAGRWYSVALPHPALNAAAAETLDVEVLQRRVLEPILGIRDPRTDKRIDFVGGIRGSGELEQLVTTGQAAVAFSMFPVSVGDLMAIADSGGIMPPKSTWFEPKLRDGLLVHLI